ncbi:hypothetical protein Afil01_66360 [Actinorhabdospora filicis]|uniref:Uncharacterized protein n=1 Tax=Actinorhabdospora filicis TaxID=1785913 RepID=A0A9W6WCP1_9ACTN|nr:hypothetical protein Afil01_66360 [Actinorhabdospora filicis]
MLPAISLAVPSTWPAVVSSCPVIAWVIFGVTPTVMGSPEWGSRFGLVPRRTSGGSWCDGEGIAVCQVTLVHSVKGIGCEIGVS